MLIVVFPFVSQSTTYLSCFYISSQSSNHHVSKTISLISVRFAFSEWELLHPCSYRMKGIWFNRCYKYLTHRWSFCSYVSSWSEIAFFIYVTLYSHFVHVFYNSMLYVCYCMRIYDILWDLNAMVWDLLWKIKMKDLMISYSMLCYGVLWKLNKITSMHRRVQNILKFNEKKPKFTTNPQCEYLFF